MDLIRWLVPALAMLSLGMGCAPKEASAPRVQLTLEGSDGVARTFPAFASRASWTVLEFFSAGCPCQAAHDDALRKLDARYRSRRVQVFAVDSEVGSSLESASREARARDYRFPILLDPGAKLADAMGAEYSTYSVVVDRDGTVTYRGGIDSSHAEIRPDSVPYLANALDDLLAGRAPRVAESKALGCALKKW